MTTRGLSWWMLMVSVVTIAACTSGGSEAVKPKPQDTTERPADVTGCASCGPRDQCVEGRCVCQPLTCMSSGKRCGQVSDGCGGVIDCGRCSTCGPDEMNCCGACIPRSEKRCPDNVHCPTTLPEM